MIVWVDRFTGWIGAIPTTKDGLTAEKTAHLMIENGWNFFGVPQIISADQGPNFTGRWWRTMCARLGIRHAYSHAHRPQANGRVKLLDKECTIFCATCTPTRI